MTKPSGKTRDNAPRHDGMWSKRGEQKGREERVGRGAFAAVRVSLARLVEGWELALRAANYPDTTIHNYTERVWRYITWIERRAVATTGTAIAPTTEHLSKTLIETYLADSLSCGAKANSAHCYHAALRTFCKWCVGEGELDRSPMEGVRAPLVPRNRPAILSDDQLRALLHAYPGPGFYDRRNLAILRLLMDTGLRRREMAGLLVANLNLPAHEVTVIGGKRRRDRTVAYRHLATQALERYLRIRDRHPDAGDPHLWLGRYGACAHQTVYRVVQEAGRAAGIAGSVYPHLIRHAWAHQWLKEGGQEHALAKMAGWENTDMAGLYGDALAEERAREAAKQMQLGDRL